LCLDCYDYTNSVLFNACPQAADRWTWLIIAVCAQLRLARPLAEDLHLPWERPARRGGSLPPGSAAASAILTGADLTGADLTGADVAGVEVSRYATKAALVWPGTHAKPPAACQ
jgi:uncharacterized protein YjbI with pentapeptide repeats